MKKLQEIIDYEFKDERLLTLALTHSSYANEEFNKKENVFLSCNERLEFLGDAVLSMVSTEYLYENMTDKAEGELTKLRAQIVCEGALYSLAQKIDLGEYMLLGKGEVNGGGRRRVSILADATEALIAAIYLDGGLPAAKKFILTYLPEMIEEAYKGELPRDYKTALQEIIQKSKEETISYIQGRTEGPDHDKRFHITLFLNTNPFTEGIGKSKKEAEQNAAKEALKMMGLIN